MIKDLATLTSIFASLIGKIETHLARKITSKADEDEAHNQTFESTVNDEESVINKAPSPEHQEKHGDFSEPSVLFAADRPG